MNFIEIVEKKLDRFNIESEIKSLHALSIIKAEEKKNKIYRNELSDLEEIINSQKNDILNEIKILLFDYFLDSKNSLIRLSKHPIYSFCLEPVDNEYINKVCGIYLLYYNNINFNEYLINFEENLTNILYHHKIIEISYWYRQSKELGNDDSFNPEYFELVYINALNFKVNELIVDKENFEEFLCNNVFNWNIFSIAYLFHFLKERKLLSADISFIKFKSFLNKDDKFPKTFNLYESEYTKPEFEFLLNYLMKYFYKDRNEYIDWMKVKVRYISKQNKKRYGDKFEIKTTGTFNSLIKNSDGLNYNDIKNLFKTIDLLENSTKYLNQN
jgi:hypothetical protein